MLFGDAVDGQMVLNNIGEIAEQEWKKTEEIRKNIKIPSTVLRLHSGTSQHPAQDRRPIHYHAQPPARDNWDC